MDVLTVVLLSTFASVGPWAATIAPAPPSYRIAAATGVEFRLDSPIDTRTAAAGSAIDLVLIGSACRDGWRLRGGAAIPARIVHAQKAGAFGKPAELLLAAGPWTPPDGSAALGFRGLAPKTGTDRNAAVLGASLAISAFAGFIRGGHVVLPAGTPLRAETRGAVDVPAAAIEPCNGDPPTSDSETHPQGEHHVEPQPDPSRPDPGPGAQRDGHGPDLPVAGERADGRGGQRAG
jgi:hypothetical protein